MNANNDEGKLISGKEAYRLIGEGVDILASVYQPDGSMQWEDAKHLPACDILNDGFKFRLAPRTIAINGIEVPAPFKPKPNEEFYNIQPCNESGWMGDKLGYTPGYCDRWTQFGAWRTEEEIKQVVAALRQVFGGAV